MIAHVSDAQANRHIEKHIGQLFHELHGDGNLASITFNLNDGTHVSFHREQRWLITPHEFGVEIRRHSDGIVIIYSAITSIHLNFGRESDSQTGPA